MRLDPGQPKSGQQEPQNKAKSGPQKKPQNKPKSVPQKKPQNRETSTFPTATNNRDEKTSHAKSEGPLHLANTPQTFLQSTTTTPKFKEEVKNSISSRFPEEHLSAVAETPVTVYYVRKLYLFRCTSISRIYCGRSVSQ